MVVLRVFFSVIVVFSIFVVIVRVFRGRGVIVWFRVVGVCEVIINILNAIFKVEVLP